MLVVSAQLDATYDWVNLNLFVLTMAAICGLAGVVMADIQDWKEIKK